MYSDKNRKPYQNIILCLFAAAAVIFAIWTAVSRANEGVAFREELLEISQQGSATVYSGELYGTAVTITCRVEDGAKLVNFSADGKYYAACRVEYPEGTILTEHGLEVPRLRILRNDEILFSGGYDSSADSGMKYYNSDGTWEPMVSTYVESSGDPWHHFAFHTSDIMRFAGGPGTAAYGSWLCYFIALFISLIGALLTAFPNTTFYLSHSLSVRDPEPTDFYYATHKIGSWVYAFIVIMTYIKGITTIV